jgi:hypothetical protein
LPTLTSIKTSLNKSFDFDEGDPLTGVEPLQEEFPEQLPQKLAEPSTKKANGTTTLGLGQGVCEGAAGVYSSMNSERANNAEISQVRSSYIKKSASIASNCTLVANLFGALCSVLPLPRIVKEKVEKAVTLVTKVGFVPYGIDGLTNGYKKKNIFQAVGFALEAILPWFANLKNMFVFRRISTGTDQIWAFTDPILKDRFPNGIFPDWLTGIRETYAAVLQLLKEIIRDPISTLLPIKKGLDGKLKCEIAGHHGLLSTLGDYVAGIGFITTGFERFFGSIGDFAASLFDSQLVFNSENNPKQRKSGAFFMGEGLLDFLARYAKGDLRLCINQLAHASGRYALELYKNSDSISESLAAA